VVAIATAVFLWTTSSAVALYAGAGSIVSVLQGWLLARHNRLRPGAA
jgi:membrane protein insertase Oxa1/YidC/SpoIIIJ